MILTSKNNPFIKETATLKDKKGRRQLGLFLVEGVKMARECQKSGLEIERVIVAESFYQSAAYAEFSTQETVCVADDVFRFLSDEKTPQGVLCRVKIPERRIREPQNCCLILDGVADPGNVGAIIRSANAAGYTEVYLTDDCADPYSPKAVRASMSGLFFTTLYQGSREELLSTMQDTPIVVADMGGENAFSFSAPQKFALVIGNEANGVSSVLSTAARYTVKIPMSVTQESLNAAVSAGILMYLLKKEYFSTIE
ncbi:MAG: RNA methyltransferase [Clostridiales bacterium]|nr:RNA methyltransferase [Clostridiales bacterium]